MTTMSSRSAARSAQRARVRGVSPRPPRARLLRPMVLTSAARRHQRSGDAAQPWTTSSATCPSRHAGPET
ncbi:MAG TPA: hypothetical protein VGB92_24165 [Longimicrobium sp.]